ncbi:MAG: AMP-binding protein [Dongiaceae bacterium]
MTAAAEFVRARDFLIAHRSDYEAANRGFRWPRFEAFNWALDYFDAMAAGNGRPALWIVTDDGKDTKISFAAMAERSNRVANWLRAQGVGRGDRILLMLGNTAPLWEIMLAAIKLGAVVIPSTTALSPADIRDRLSRGGASCVIAGAGDAAKFEALPAGFRRIAVGGTAAGWRSYDEADGASPTFVPDGPSRAGDPILFYFTSGTTARAKLVVHTHVSYPVGHLSTMYWLGLMPGDIHLNISSPGWAKHAWSCFFAPWNAGATVFIHAAAKFVPQDTLATIQRCAVTTLCAPPTVWRMFVQHDLTAYKTKLRDLVGAGEPLNPEVIDTVRRAWGITIRDGYGQTETTALVGNAPGQPVKPGSMGRPLPGYDVRLVDSDGREASEGEVCLALDPRPVGLMPGYGDDSDSASRVSAAGYYRTGDVAMRDADGYLTFVGRADDVFKASDYRISPFEIESALIEHDAVAEAAVVPSPDPIRLAVPKAFVLLARAWAPDRATAESIFQHSRATLAPYKRIRRLEFGELPKTISGKIRRVELRQAEMARAPGAPRRAHEYWEEDFPEIKDD